MVLIKDREFAAPEGPSILCKDAVTKLIVSVRDVSHNTRAHFRSPLALATRQLRQDEFQTKCYNSLFINSLIVQ
jgi:hypothetical protein